MTRPDFSVVGSTVHACNKVVEYLAPILEGGSNEIDKVYKVERHIGRFNTEKEVKRWMSHRDGGVRIAALSVVGYEKVSSAIIGSINMAAYVFAGDVFSYEKDTRAEVIAGKLAAALMNKDATPGCYSKPEAIRADNLYSFNIDDLGVAIWAVSWNQKWQLNVPIDPADLDDFIKFGLRGELADGAPALEGEVTLPQGE
ncbi:hypothetical protein KW494_10265 [Vibrio fluvialis]|uniref:hypothetical protein n=1 Tax=Vibrio fluvialis TaxID=676 RepID=UPI001C9CCAD5|nr:hypothetical protein [Vibrio fluvialis]MBY8111734.1 hypothetical protein [Vibrio fluvialis]MBY8295304.1 hypothetical protein [Vibrio fluvialis]MCE7641090.1 hypothetical protein [Vibrio fluvialis]